MALLTLLQQLWQELHRATLFTSFLLPLLFLFSILLLLNLPRGDKLMLPPSPPKLPLIGNLHQLGTLPHRSFQALSNKFGPLMLLQLGNAQTLVVSSAELAREIMYTHDTTFANRIQTKAANVFYYGCKNLAFCPYGDYWRQARKICVLELLTLKRVQSFQFIREEEVADLIEKTRCLCLQGASITDLGEMLVSTSNNIVSRAVFGRKFGEEDGEKSFGELSRRAMELFGAFCFEDFFPSMGWMDALTGLSANLKETCQGLHAFLDQVIDEHKISKREDDQSDKTDFVDTLLRLEKDGMLDIDLTQDNLKAILLDMFIAGTDTASATMEWTMAELVKNPTMMKKAQGEVRRVARNKSKIDEADINKMDYLNCIIKETLRLYTPAPFLIPRVSNVSVPVGGYNIPPKTRVFINVWAIQRDPKLWDRPEEFLPERFENNPVDFKGQDFQFIPFGAGRRRCPGMTFGILETKYVLANLLCWFNWDLPGGTTRKELDMSESFGLVMHKKIPLHLVPSLHPP